MSKIDKYGYPKELVDHKEIKKDLESFCSRNAPDAKLGYTSEQIEAKKEKIYDKHFKSGGQKFQDDIREAIKELTELVLKKETGRPIGTDEKTIKRYSKIRAKYDSMLIKGFTPGHIRKTLAKEENLEESTIKGIYYSQKL